MSVSTDCFRLSIRLPEQLVPSLLHVGAQRIDRVRVENQSKAAGQAEIEVRILGLSLQPIRLSTSPIPSGMFEDFLNVTIPLESLDRVNLASLEPRDTGLPCTIEGMVEPGQACALAEVRMLPPNAWEYGGHPEALAAFVQKESQAVTSVVRAARPFLRQLLGVESFADALDAPLSTSRDRVRSMVQAIYQTLEKSYGIQYSREIRTYPPAWQKVRFHDRVLRDREGTCIDLALLLAACLESVHLNPMIALVKTGADVCHALVGCWGNDGEFRKEAVLDDGNGIASQVRSSDGRGNLVFFDPTGLCIDRRWTFEQACDEGFAWMTQPSRFVWGVNIAATRVPATDRDAISPLPFGAGPWFTREAAMSIRCAEELAREFRYDLVERGHLFLALLRSPNRFQSTVLSDRVSEAIHETETRLLAKSPHKEARTLRRTRGLERLIVRAVQVAELHGGGTVGVLQLLHALIESPGQTLGRILRKIEIDAFALIAALIELAGQDPQRTSYLESAESRWSGDEHGAAVPRDWNRFGGCDT